MFESMISVSMRMDVRRIQGLRLLMLYLYHIVHTVTVKVIDIDLDIGAFDSYYLAYIGALD